MRNHATAAVALVAAIVASATAEAQGTADRVAAVRDGLVRFSFASRSQVCGNSRGGVSLGSYTFIGTTTVNEGSRAESCDRGPVHVILNRAGGVTTHLETYVGSRDPDVAGSRDLGRVAARDAAQYLFGIAASGEGRPPRDAILPAALADSAEVFAPLLALARDASRPREIRSSAITWLGRAGGELNAAPQAQVITTLLGLARDAALPKAFRDQSVAAVYRLPRGEGIASLIDIVRSQTESALPRYVLNTMSASGDPRVRELLRELAQPASASDSMRFLAIQGLGRNYAAAQDIALLRSLYQNIVFPASRSAIISGVAGFGGSDNARWLLAIGMDPNEDVARKRLAIQGANRAEAPLSDFISAYERAGDRTTREELIAVYAARGDRAAVDKLIAIARADTDPALRRSAITRLSRLDDPRVAAVLREIAIPR